MIIFASTPGRLGNLLIISASLKAWGLQHGRLVRIPAFYPYRRYFRKSNFLTRQLIALGYRFSYVMARIADRMEFRNSLVRAVHIDWHEHLNLDKGILAIEKPAFCFLQGWQYRANDSLRQHTEAIRKLYSPRPKYQKQIDEFFEQQIPAGRKVAGIHVRRGDYRKFENGKYFYPVATYLSVMSAMERFAGPELVFIICSDEPQVFAEFQNRDKTVIRAPGHVLLDLYILARCSYIAGPPSTYSMWASFYGQVPLYMIKDPNPQPEKPDFIVQDHF